MRGVFEMWQQMTVGENSSFFGPWIIVGELKKIQYKLFDLIFILYH